MKTKRFYTVGICLVISTLFLVGCQSKINGATEMKEWNTTKLDSCEIYE